jgi:hypothetical protein
MKFISALAVTALIFTSCVTTEKKETVEETETTEMQAEVAEPEVNADSLVAAIDDMRTSIEGAIGEPLSVSTEGLRAKVQQKWSTIHFYTVDGELARIKTYPHEGVSKRTEEFYVSGGELVLVTIEDDGSGEKGKSKDAFDKMYYFHQGEVIKEMGAEDEAEYSIRKSDGEELLSEFQEYKEIFESNK